MKKIKDPWTTTFVKLKGSEKKQLSALADAAAVEDPDICSVAVYIRKLLVNHLREGVEYGTTVSTSSKS